MAPIQPCFLSDPPQELINFLTNQAEVDADRVIEKLQQAGIAKGSIDPRVALALAAITRMDAWERIGINIHMTEGLPSAHDALDRLLTAMEQYAAHPELLAEVDPWNSVTLRLAVEHMAWTGPSLLAADVELGILDDELLLDELARLLLSIDRDLWKERAS